MQLRSIIPHERNPHCLTYYRQLLVTSNTENYPHLRPIRNKEQQLQKYQVNISSILNTIIQALEWMHLKSLEEQHDTIPHFQLYYQLHEPSKTYKVYLIDKQETQKVKPETYLSMLISSYVNLIEALVRMTSKLEKSLQLLQVKQLHEKVKTTKGFEQFSNFCEYLEDCSLFIRHNHATHMKIYSIYGMIFKEFRQNEKSKVEEQMVLRMFMQDIYGRNQKIQKNKYMKEEMPGFMLHQNQLQMMRMLRDWKKKDKKDKKYQISQEEKKIMKKHILQLQSRLMSSNLAARDFYRENFNDFLRLFKIKTTDEITQKDDFWLFRRNFTIKPLAKHREYELIVGYNHHQGLVQVVVLTDIPFNLETNCFLLLKKAIMEQKLGMYEISIKSKSQARMGMVISVKEYTRFTNSLRCFRQCLYLMTISMAVTNIIEKQLNTPLLSDDNLNIQKEYIEKINFYLKRWKGLSEDMFYDNWLLGQLNKCMS